MKKLEIYEDEWLHGEGSSNSFLYRSSDGKKCCLGFYAEQILNIKTEQIKNKTTLQEADFTPPLRYIDDMMQYNDFIYHANFEKERKKYLISLFKENNIEIIFLPTNPNK